MLRFYRNDGSTSPATAENIDLQDDGRFTGWRTVAPAVGWFEGTVDPSERDEIRAATASLTLADPGLPPPGSAVETLELPDRDAFVVTGVNDDTPLGVVVSRSRRLLDDMVDSPRAAIALAAESPMQLVHRGVEPVELDLSAVVLKVHHWRGYYEPAGSASELVTGSRSQAEPGWTFDLPAISPPPGPDITTHLTVDLVIVANGIAVPVQVQHLPVMAPPPE